MSSPTIHRSTMTVLHQLLSAPDLVQQIQALPAPTLLKLVNNIGMEDSSCLLAMATGEQLTRMIDEDLWRNTGKGEEFDPARFRTWLLAMEEMGYARAAGKLSDMDEDFLALALGQYLFVLELEAVHFMRVNIQGDSWEDDRLEKILESYHTQEIGGFLILAKADAPWESLQPLLLALDDCDSSLTGRVLQRLASAGEAKAEREGGLYEVLSSEEMLECDAAHSRDQRRIRDGFVPASDAAAFMAWIRATPDETLLAMREPDPVSRAYMRDYRGLVLAPVLQDTSAPLSPQILELLGAEARRSPLKLEGKKSAFTGWIGRQPMRSAVLVELNFLAQVVMQTEGILRPAEAAERVMTICELGMERAHGDPASAVHAFALGVKAQALI